nr:splicing factor SF3a60 homolog [Ipomoea batatas]
MSSTLLEVTRASHEEIERLERLIVKDLQTEPATNKDRLHQSHRVRNVIEQILESTHKLVDIYEDKDGARKDEIAALGGQTATGTNVFSAFYDRLKEIREYHRRHPAARVVDTSDEQYKEYLQKLLEYLIYFFERTEPLQDTDRIFSKEFKCEICGNHSYWGRRAYERHFKEWRHQHGMRCLGIPNTKNFNEITSIEEAKQLWERIQERQGLNKWRPDLEEEYEDQEGNIYNKKTYTDLQRQGLI